VAYKPKQIIEFFMNKLSEFDELESAPKKLGEAILANVREKLDAKSIQQP
jgi:hypothetical protein